MLVESSDIDKGTRWVAWLATPVNASTGRVRISLAMVGVVIGVLYAWWVADLHRVFHAPDSSHYLLIAQGRTAEVLQPFASRQLGALSAAWLGNVFGRMFAAANPLHLGFLSEAGASLVVTLAVVMLLMVRTAAPRWMLPAAVVVPFWFHEVQLLVLPDLWYAALLAVLLWLLASRRLMAAALMMLPLMLSRESTSLTLICFLVACWGGMRWRHRVAAVVSFLMGAFSVAWMARDAQPNPEHLPGMVYLFAKVPWNFLRNVIGVIPWSNANTDLCKVPVWSTPVHLPFHLGGSVQAVGVCGFSYGQQFMTLYVMLGEFGLLPLLVGCLWWRQRGARDGSLLLRFALIYGAACLLLAPVLGAGFQHLVSYAWPLFLVALPMLFGPSGSRLDASRAWACCGFLLLHLILCVLIFWTVAWPKVFVEVAIWLAAFWLMLRWLPKEPMQNAMV